MTIRSYVRRPAVGKNKAGSIAVPHPARTRADAPGRIAFGTLLMSWRPRVGFVGDRQHQCRILAALMAGICATRSFGELNRALRIGLKFNLMARSQPQWRSSRRPQRRPSPASETTLQTAGRYGLIAIASGIGMAFGANALEAAQERQAILDALPAGYTYSGCNEVRAAGVVPL